MAKVTFMCDMTIRINDLGEQIDSLDHVIKEISTEKFEQKDIDNLHDIKCFLGQILEDAEYEIGIREEADANHED